MKSTMSAGDGLSSNQLILRMDFDGFQTYELMPASCLVSFFKTKVT